MCSADQNKQDEHYKRFEGQGQQNEHEQMYVFIEGLY